MKITNDKFLQIGELAKMLSITTRTIRYYEEIGLIPPPDRLERGTRIYDKEGITRLKFILKLKELGLSLKEMKELAQIYKIHNNPSRIMPRLLELLDGHIQKIDNKISKLASLRRDIASYRQKISELLTIR